MKLDITPRVSVVELERAELLSDLIELLRVKVSINPSKHRNVLTIVYQGDQRSWPAFEVTVVSSTVE